MKVNNYYNWESVFAAGVNCMLANRECYKYYCVATDNKTYSWLAGLHVTRHSSEHFHPHTQGAVLYLPM